MNHTIVRKPYSWLAGSFQIAALAVIALLLSVSLVVPSLAQEAPSTIEEGNLIVAFSSVKPISYLEGEKLTGVDGDIITAVATALGLTLVPEEMSFEESLTAVTDGTADVAIGDIYGTEERAGTYSLTDPVYFNATILAVRDGVTVASVADLADKIIGTGEGYSYVSELQGIPGVKEVKEFASAEAVIADLGAGTIDVAVLDPPVLSLAAAENPDWELQLVTVEFDSATSPILAAIQPAVFAVNKDNPDLAAAISAEIATMQEDGSLQAILEAHGLTDPSYTTPPAS
jgi:polar amino acid transport system substrate-binding protein